MPDSFTTRQTRKYTMRPRGLKFTMHSTVRLMFSLQESERGGTLSGVGRYLKEQNPDIRIIGVEPTGSPLISQGHAGPHDLQGIGANFIPENLDRNVFDEIVTVENEEAYEMGRKMAREEGVLVGISAGAAVCAAVKVGKRPENHGRNVVALLPDTGERYLSTKMFEE